MLCVHAINPLIWIANLSKDQRIITITGRSFLYKKYSYFHPKAEVAVREVTPD